LYSNGQLGDAEAAITRDLELDPDDESTMNQAAYILVAAGKPQEALAMANRIEKSPEWRLEVLPFIYDALGRRIDADAALNELIKTFGNSEALSVAGFYAHRGETDQAFSWLQRAYSDRNPAIWNLPSDPNFAPLHRDARYSVLLRQLGLIN
jgi:Flp pilus assembly protein TadD